MINFIQPGDIIEITAPVGGVTSGSPVKIGSIVGIAAQTVLAGVAVNIQVSGVFDVAKVSLQAWSEGDGIYWDDSAAVMTTVKAGNLFVGVAVDAATSPSSTGRIRLNASGYDAGFQWGESGSPIVDDTAGVVFVEGHFDCGATSGDNKGLSINLAPTGVLQTYSTAIFGGISPSVNVRNPVAVQGDVYFGVAGSVQGLGYGVGTYFQFPAATLPGTGNYAGMNIEFNLPASCDASPATRTSMLRFVMSGDPTAKATFETTGAAMSFVDFTEGSDKIINSDNLTIGTGDPANVIGLRVGIGTGGGGDAFYYIPLVPEADWN